MRSLATRDFGSEISAALPDVVAACKVAGFDVVVVEWPSTGFVITTVEGVTYLDSVSGASGADHTSLRNVESVQFSDRTVSLELPDVFQNTPGSDNFNGGPGLDTVVYAGKRADYTVQAKDAGLSVRRSDLSEDRKSVV